MPPMVVYPLLGGVYPGVIPMVVYPRWCIPGCIPPYYASLLYPGVYHPVYTLLYHPGYTMVCMLPVLHGYVATAVQR